MTKIKFGTSGWRAVIADEFTFANVRIVAQAIADYVKSKNRRNPSVIVGGDTRFLSEKFSEAATEVLCANGVKTYLCNRDTPTPVISFEIIRRKLDGGINFTASHNPFQYQGLKFSPASGGPATPEITRAIEMAAESPRLKVKTVDLKQAASAKLLETVDPSRAYLKYVRSLVDGDAIKKSKIKTAVDILHGTARGYLDVLLEEYGAASAVMGLERDVLFGATGSPEPSRDNLKKLVETMKSQKLNLGLAADGDADRFGIIDEDGTFMTPNAVIAVLLWHLVKTRGYKGLVARSVMTTHLIDRVAAHLGVEVVEKPVGFKYIGEVMVKENSAYPSKKGDFIIGGEESGGLTIRGHVPEKDGILACLLALEAVAVNRRPLKDTLAEIMSAVGAVYSDRLNFHLELRQMDSLRLRLAKSPPKEIGGLTVKKTVTLDGHKFIFDDNSWMGIRLSGTEPVVRLYIEADKESKLRKLAGIGEDFIKAQ